MLITHIFSVMYLHSQGLNSWFFSKKPMKMLKVYQVPLYGERPEFYNVIYQSWNPIEGIVSSPVSICFLCFIALNKSGRKLYFAVDMAEHIMFLCPDTPLIFHRFLKGNFAAFSRWPWTAGKHSQNLKPPPLIFSHGYCCYLSIKSTHAHKLFISISEPNKSFFSAHCSDAAWNWW